MLEYKYRIGHPQSGHIVYNKAIIMHNGTITNLDHKHYTFSIQWVTQNS